jgi:hypothetical protein
MALNRKAANKYDIVNAKPCEYLVKMAQMKTPIFKRNDREDKMD